MSNNSQMDLLLNQLYSCSISIYNAIVKDDEQEANNLMSQKYKLLNLIKENKKFISGDFAEIFRGLIRKLDEQENKNIQLLKAKKNVLYKQYNDSLKKSALHNKYGFSSQTNGNIVDIIDE